MLCRTPIPSTSTSTRLRDQVRGRPDPYVMFNNLPRASDADRFLVLLGAQG